MSLSRKFTNLRCQKCNKEILYEMLKPHTWPKDIKVQKFPACVLKAIGVFSNIANSLLDLKSNKSLSTNDMRKALAPFIHVCTEFIALLSHLNSEIEQNRRENIWIASTADRIGRCHQILSGCLVMILQKESWVSP